MGIEFKIAAAAARADAEVIEINLGDFGTVEARRPTTAQAQILGADMQQMGTVNAALAFIEMLVSKEAAEYLRGLIRQGVIDREDLVGGWGENDEGLNEEGLVDQIIKGFTGRPTAPSTGSSRSQTAGGRRSTGRTPGKGSTRSPSPSTAS